MLVDHFTVFELAYERNSEISFDFISIQFSSNSNRSLFLLYSFWIQESVVKNTIYFFSFALIQIDCYRRNFSNHFKVSRKLKKLESFYRPGGVRVLKKRSTNRLEPRARVKEIRQMGQTVKVLN